MGLPADRSLTSAYEAQLPPAHRVLSQIADPLIDDRRLRSTADPEVPRSLAMRDLARVAQSLARAMGAAAMTAVTAGAGITAVTILIGLTIGFSQSPRLTSPELLPASFLWIACGGLVAVVVTMCIGLLHFVLPRVTQFFCELLRAPWFVPSTLLCAPAAVLWRWRLLWPEPWEFGLTRQGLRRMGSFRTRRYAGIIDNVPLELRQDLLGGALEVRCRVPSRLPAVYVGPQKVAGAVGILRPLVRCPALIDAELWLRDGWLIIRRRWVRPQVGQLAALVNQLTEDYPNADLVTELQTLSLLADWPQLLSVHEDHWPTSCFESTAITRHLETLEHALRLSPPSLDTLERVLADPAIRPRAKSWLMSVVIERLSAEATRRLSDGDDLIADLRRAPDWPAWLSVRRLELEGGPDALAGLQSVIASPRTPTPLRQLARRAVMHIIQRNGGIHTLTGHLSLVASKEGGQLTVVDNGSLAVL